jgi:hypothetical protein
VPASVTGLNGETQLPPGLRQVKGFIPVDIYQKTDVPTSFLANQAPSLAWQSILDWVRAH